MVEAMETMKKALLNMETLFVMLAKENKVRSLHVARKIQAMEKGAADRAEAGRREQARKLGDMAANIEKLRAEVAANREVASAGNELVESKLRKQMTALEARMSHYALDADVRRWTTEGIADATAPLQRQIDTNQHMFWEKLERLVEENLVVPGLIGDDDTCRYKNMAAYVHGRRVELTDELS